MPGFQEVMRCSMCGNLIQASTDIVAESKCPKCQADLRSCKHCRHFDTGAQFECTQPVTARVMAKDKVNDCSFFEPRTSIERETKTPVSVTATNPSTPKDARSAFDDLFR
jgi:phage FluMu protein Com